MSPPRAGLVTLFVFAFAWGVAQAQTPSPEPDAAAPTVPTVTFTFDWAVLHPPHYSIAVDSAGRAAYTVGEDPSGSGAPYTVHFTVSRTVRERIFADVEALKYFQGQFDFTRHKIAFTGSKTLAYADARRRFQTTYNWSENARLMALTQLFMGIANTLAGGRRLEYLRRYDRLGIDDELKTMEGLAKTHDLLEVHTIEPVLREIADDSAIMNLARKRARHLLELAAAENATSAEADRSPKSGTSPD